MQIHVTRVALSHAPSLAFPGLSSTSTLAQRPRVPALPTQFRASQARDAAATPQRTRRDTGSITGYRPGLQFATGAKKDSTASTDSIFVKGWGKFPDTRIGARSIRIPALQSNSDVSGEGLDIAIRGRGGRFPSTVINAASVARASIDLYAIHQSREVEFHMPCDPGIPYTIGIRGRF